MMHRRRAFTVVELVVVIAIIGVLIVLVPPAGLGWDSMTMNYPPNGPIVGSTIAAYQCPADPGRKPVVHGATPGSRSNYVGCFSPDGTMVERSAWDSRFAYDPGPPNNPSPTDFRAAFNWNVAHPLHRVRDGIDLAVWRAIASIDGGEPTADF